jgi:SAM-dependent methyltransferase
VYFVSTTARGAAETVTLRLYSDRCDNEVTSYTNTAYITLRTSDQGSVATGRSIYHDRTSGGALEMESRRFAGHLLRGVLQQRRDRHDEVDANAVHGALFEDTLRSFGVEDLIDIGEGWQLSLGGARHELKPDAVFSSSSAYALPETTRATNLQAGDFRDLTATSRVDGTLARKTRLPTLKDRDSQRLGSDVENPALGAERSLNLEFGYVGQPLKNLAVEAAVFQSQVDDRIQSTFIAADSGCSAATPCQMHKVGETRVSGVERWLRSQLDSGIELGGNLTVMDQKSVYYPSIRAIGVPDRKLFVHALVKPAAQWSLQATLEYNSARWASNTAQLPGYPVAGLKARWQPMKGLSLEVGATTSQTRFTNWMPASRRRAAAGSPTCATRSERLGTNDMTLDDIDCAALYREHMWRNRQAPKPASAWDTRAADHGRTLGAQSQQITYIDDFLARLDLSGASSVLDIGCGPGTLALPLAQRGLDLVALDYRERMLEQLLEKAGAAGLVSIRAPHRAWEDDWHDVPACDIAIALRSTTVDDLEMALHKMARHARLRACLSHPANGFFVGREVLALLGAKPPVLPDPLLALGMLRRMGAHPRVVHFLMPSRLAGCASFDEFEQRLRWSTGPLDEGCGIVCRPGSRLTPSARNVAAGRCAGP